MPLKYLYISFLKKTKNKHNALMAKKVIITWEASHEAVVGLTFDEDIDVNIHIIGEDAKTHFGDPVMVAGIWHLIEITLEENGFSNLNVKLYNGSEIPSVANRNEQNYYEWKYSKNTPQWSELTNYEYSYIDVTNCTTTDNGYSFFVGIRDSFPDILDYYENWTLDIIKDGIKLC